MSERSVVFNNLLLELIKLQIKAVIEACSASMLNDPPALVGMELLIAFAE